MRDVIRLLVALALPVLVVACGHDDLVLAGAADAGAAAPEATGSKADTATAGTDGASTPVGQDVAPPPDVEPEDVAVATGPDAAPLHPPGDRGVCDPCAASKDCADPTASCVGLGDPAGANGLFCQAPCGPLNACPEGAHCQARSTTENEVVLSCVPDSNQCACSSLAAKNDWQTPCFLPSFSKDGWVVGKCGGAWNCGSGGCTAKAPKAEACNGLDDDCDGKTDEQEGDLPADNLCNDGNACTTGEACKDGACVAGVNECTCQSDKDCAGQDVCKGKWFCDKATPKWKCNVVPSTAPNCSKIATTACTVSACDAKKGCLTVPKADGVGCDADGDSCTANDACKAGACKAGAVVGCDDGNPCTYDNCGKAGCSHVATVGACDDGNACTANDACKKGACVGGALGCSDGNPCTADSCDAATGKCVTAPGNAGGGCDDGDPCTLADSCTAGACKGTGTAACDDANPCTTDSCEPGKGCAHAANTANCDDGNACTKDDQCQGGGCKGGGSVCGCQQQADCDAQTATNPCLGAMICNLVANPPACVPKPGAPAFCPEAGPCLTATCSAGKCGTVPAKDGSKCSDGNPCSQADACEGGGCKGVGVSCDDGNACTVDSCAQTGQGASCQYQPATGTCSDNSPCTVGDSCAGGKCAPGPAKDCADALPCTLDSCDGKTGACKHDTATLQAKVCTSGQGACGPAVCANGVCTLQTATPCDDGNACTDDACASDVGCKHTANTASCNDNNPCTLVDTCGVAKCAGTKPNLCDDGNVCTDDSCAPAVGCEHVANKVTCDDGDLCTEDDLCAATVCKGKAKNCGDSNPCTKSICDKGVCGPQTNVPDATACKGKSACNGDATCLAGVCVDPAGTCPNKKGREIVPPVIPPTFQKAKTLFDPIGMHEVKLVVDPADWAAYMALVAKAQKGTTWWAATVEIDGKDYGKTGIRPFGYGSLFTNPQKPNIRVKFDAHVAGNEGPDDVHSLRFKASGQDSSWIKQLLGPMIVQQIGGYGPRYSWARLWINGQPFGMYQMIEHVDKHFYKVNFDNNDGNEYQRKNSCMGLNCPGGVCANLASYYIGDPGAATEVVALATMGKSEPDASLEKALNSLVDMDSLLAQYAWEAIASDIDTLAAAGQNYTIYMNQATAKMEFIPTGEDLVLGKNGGWYNLYTPWGPPNTWCKNRIDEFFTRLVSHVQMKAKFNAMVQKAHCGPFDAKTFVPMILAYKKLLWNDIVYDPKGYLTAAQVDKAYADLVKYVQDRNVYLDTTVGVCP